MEETAGVGAEGQGLHDTERRERVVLLASLHYMYKSGGGTKASPCPPAYLGKQEAEPCLNKPNASGTETQ